MARVHFNIHVGPKWCLFLYILYIKKVRLRTCLPRRVDQQIVRLVSAFIYVSWGGRKKYRTYNSFYWRRPKKWSSARLCLETYRKWNPFPRMPLAAIDPGKILAISTLEEERKRFLFNSVYLWMQTLNGNIERENAKREIRFQI